MIATCGRSRGGIGLRAWFYGKSMCDAAQNADSMCVDLDG